MMGFIHAILQLVSDLQAVALVIVLLAGVVAGIGGAVTALLRWVFSSGN